MHEKRSSYARKKSIGRMLILAFVVGASTLLVETPVQAQPLTKDQLKCSGSLTKSWSKVSGAAVKQVAGCLKNNAKGKALSKSDPAVVTLEQCVVSDEKGKIQLAKDKTDEAFARFCTGTDKNGAPKLPPYAVTDAATVKAEASAHGVDLAHAVFSSDLDSGVFIPEATDKAAAKCQLGIWKATGKCDATRFKEFASCKKLALKDGSITSAQDLEDTCLGIGDNDQPDPKGKIAKACTGPQGGIGKAVSKCDEGLALESLVPECAQADPTQCVQDKITTQGCSAINAADGLSRDCTSSAATCEDDNRVVFYVPNWVACPSFAQLSLYTHAMVAFAVTYPFWNQSGDNCGADTSCTLQALPGCGGLPASQMVDLFHAAGAKAILSFGGAGMGGSWAGSQDTCWEHCLDKAPALAAELTSLVMDAGFDGIDIDYEYHLGQEHVDFLIELTNELRVGLDAASPGVHKTISHAPMDSNMDILGTCPSAPGAGNDLYIPVLEATTAAVDFIMPQFYNGCFRPQLPSQTAGFLANYGAIVDQVYGGDASRVAVGLCAEDCSSTGSNATPAEVVDVLEQVHAQYPTNGGMMLWDSRADSSLAYSEAIWDWRLADVCPGITGPSLVMINEVLATPTSGTSPVGDANCDDVFDPLEDEFVEILNLGAFAADLSGATLHVASSGLSHTFAAGTVLEGGGAIVVFGGGDPTFDGSSTSSAPWCVTLGPGVQVVTASAGLDVSSSADTLTLSDSSGTPIDTVTFNADGGGPYSLNRLPDLDPTAPLFPHIWASSTSAILSPGTTASGTSF
jgi:chitinase